MEDALAYHFTNANIRYRENAGTIYYYDASVAQKAIFEPILFRAASQYKSIYIPLPEHSQTDKYIRIEATLTSALSSGKVVFSNKLKENPDWEEARLQLLGFEKGAKLNDDFPDTLEACVRLSQDYAVSDDQVFTPVIGNGEREGY
jgi:hypothetical protein